MPASPLGKTGSTKIKPVGQTGGSHFGTDETARTKGRSTTPRSNQVLGK